MFGAEIARGRKMAELWGAAVDTLLAMAEAPPPELLPIEGHAPYRLPAFDADAMLTEASLLIDWFWPAQHGKPMPQALREEFAALWRPLLAMAVKSEFRLGVARLPLAEPDVAARPGRREARGTARLPGCAAEARLPTTSYRFSRTRGSTFRKRLNVTNSLATVPPEMRKVRIFRAMSSVRSMRRLAPNVTRRSSASLPDWRNVTASAAISLISRGSRAILSATSPTLRSRSCAASMRASSRNAADHPKLAIYKASRP